jgi:hypothetical protein
VPDAAWTQRERDTALLDHLERRRNAHDQAMWQAPALTIAGQAFLLRVNADEGLEWWARGRPSETENRPPVTVRARIG